MSTRSLRNRVSSRLPSPAITPETDQANSINAERNGDGGSDIWIEPPVRKLPPSYQDHKGLERIGVLELQQSLGEPPSQKLLQRLKLTYNRPSNPATPLHNEEVLTPSVGSERPEFGSPDDAQGLSTLSPNEHTIAVTSPPRGRPAKRDAEEMRNPARLPESTPSPMRSSPGTSFFGTHQKLSIQEHLRQDRVSNYLEKAIEEAHRNGDLGLVPGLTKLQDKAYENRDLWLVLEAVAQQSPSRAQLKVFKHHIKKGVRQHRKQSARSGSSPHSAFPSNQGHWRIAKAAQPEMAVSPTITGLSSTATNPAPTFTSPFRPRSGTSRSQNLGRAYPSVHLSRSSRRSRMEADTDRSPGQQPSSATTPRRQRAGSQSSLSSLSSAQSIPEEYGPDAVEAEGDDELPDERTSQLPTGGQRQADKSNPTTAKRRSSALSHPNSKHPFHNYPDVAKIAAKKLKSSKEDFDYDPADIEKRRKRFQSASAKLHNIPYIDADVSLREEGERYRQPIRFVPADIISPAPPVVHAWPLRANEKNVEISTSSYNSGLPDKHLRNASTRASTRKRTMDEMLDNEDDDDLSDIRTPSPIPYLLIPPPPLGVTRGSRSGTPRVAKHPAVNKARKSARVMVSPNKPKNGGITAGISRVGPTKDPTAGNGADSGAEDNDEFCASCGGEGKLLCCDGCSNSLHHSCLEPPLDPEEEVDGEWYCPQCKSKRNKTTLTYHGILGKLIGRVSDTIPKAFALPVEVRDYFDGVRTGDGGEYEDVGQSRTQTGLKMNRAGFFEEPNYKEARDGKGKLLTCYSCKEAANGRDLIPCDFCENRWHLDCLDPPLAVPPRRRIGDKANATWRCPLHVEQDLAGLGRQAEAAPGDLGRRVRPRKPKNSRPVDVNLSRGFKNNGIIEVDVMPDVIPQLKEVNMGGRVFRLPEMGIRLDFIDRVKKGWYEDVYFGKLAGRPQAMKDRLYRPTGSVTRHEPAQFKFKIQEPEFFKGAQAVAIAAQAKANAALRQRSFAEQQVALNLMDLAKATPGYSGDTLGDLTNQLIRSAPPSVEAAIQRDEKARLLELQKLLQQRLRILDGVELPPTQPPAHLTPAPAVSQVTKYKPIQPYPAQPPQPVAGLQHDSFMSGSISNGFTNTLQQPHNGAGTQNDYNASPEQQSYTPFQALQHSPSFPALSAAVPPPPFDVALDPRLFGNGDSGHDEGNDGDIDMD